MGKQGPCYHCGVTSTPLWRNGPPEKPILCNACGSRWRTKGTLSHYTPLHARAEPDEFEDYRVSRLKSISIKNKEAKVLKRKHNHDSAVVGGITPDYSRGSLKGLDDDTSNRSSSGSVISNSESCVQFSSPDASDLTGQAQSLVWDKMVPSRKRTCVSRPKTSSMEKLTKDLCTILHEQQSQFSGTSEEELIFEIDTPMTSVEIGHGSVLIRHPSSIGREEESEASSLSVDKPYSLNEGYSCLTALPVHKGAKFPSTGNIESKKPSGQGTQLEHIKREKAKQEKIQILGHDNSPLRYVDLKYVLNFDQFASHLTNEEQHQLLKYLPPVDTTRLPDSLKSMFASLQFEENLSSFQNLLGEGVFDLSLSGVKDEDCRTLNKLVLCNLKKSEWVEQYTILKDENSKSGNRESVTPGGPNGAAFGNSANVKRSCDGHFQNFPGAKTTLKSPKRVVKGSYKHKEIADDDGYCFSPRSLFALPPDISSLMIDSFQFMGESSDQDLLLDVPSNGSFPQAELLVPTSSFGVQATTSSSSIYS